MRLCVGARPAVEFGHVDAGRARAWPLNEGHFYAGNNFTGGVVYQVEGPAVIVNDSLTDPYSMLGKKEFITNDWSGDPSEYVSQFTIALRYLVKDSVFSWLGKKPASLWASKTGSFRVTCD